MCMRVWSICTCIDLSAAFSSSLAFVRPSILQFGLSGCIQQQLRMPYWPAFVYVGRWWMSCSSLTGSCRRSLSACWSFPASCRLCSSCMLLGFTRAPAVSPAADQCKHMDPSCRSLRQLFLVDLSPLDSGGISHVDAQRAAVIYSDPMFNHPRPAAGSILFLPPAICLGA
jgi:hypothetical protein